MIFQRIANFARNGRNAQLPISIAKKSISWLIAPVYSSGLRRFSSSRFSG
jgi:hypothetical protein